MPISQAKKRGNFHLDIEDMPRHMVDLRRDLDREKRRFQAAKMVNEFEDQLRKVLRDLNGQGQDPAGANGDTNVQPQNSENGIQLTVIDRENLNRLLVFLKYTIEMCQRIDQQELMQEVLRSALQDTRRKRFKTQQEVPGTPIEPFCLFCASDLNSVLVTNCHDESHRQQQAASAQPLAITGISNITMPRVELVHLTPPPSAMPTPDVGDQAGIYTPNINLTTNVGNHQNNATPSPTLGHADGVVRKATGLSNGLLKKTNASAAAASAAPTVRQPPSASPASSGVVGPSDVDESSSDNEPASLQDVVEWAERSRGPPGGDNDSDDHRSSTPLCDDPERTMSRLVIDESSQESQGIASPIYRPEMKAANNSAKTSSKSIKTIIKGGNAVATSSSAATSSLSRSVEIKSQPSQASRSESATARPTETSAASLSTIEQSQPSQQIRGASSVRTKFHPKRRNRND